MCHDRIRPRIRLVVLLLCVVCFSNPVLAASDDDRWKDWQVQISSKSLQNFLAYPQSKLPSISEVTVVYAQPDDAAVTTYESLWYTKGQPIGCHRWNNLDLTPGTAGVIKVLDTEPSRIQATANAVLRICLDLALSRCMTRYVSVPQNCFKSMILALEEKGFRPPSRAPGSAVEPAGMVSIQLISQPDEQMQRLLIF